jgi:hypothetical protein
VSRSTVPICSFQHARFQNHSQSLFLSSQSSSSYEKRQAMKIECLSNERRGTHLRERKGGTGTSVVDDMLGAGLSWQVPFELEPRIDRGKLRRVRS